ncbi:nardilysin-like isoform X1 [Chiloscyllium plagiosum]|uniref:nardilysin-like isoform X1 n=1 Tax=Chiloscyllium plagiosum TaxID=36176 RepID=UPI001CB831A6|nr:nardilysin-like isoform X1 [Chiloscyllium plagiosum]
MPVRNKSKSSIREKGQNVDSGTAATAAVDTSEQEQGQGEEFNPEKNRGDPGIVKSPNDPKEYRYIKLENGLSTLLISDMSTGGGDEAEDEEENEEEEEEEEMSDSVMQTEEEESDNDDGSSESPSDGESIEEHLEDYDDEFGELAGSCSGSKKNSEKQSAAALCVGIGSFSDPDDLPGLAHFLEHMVFMGSERYPDENGFDAFLKRHGGSDNASTDCEHTVFQFDIQRKYFKEALDRWAQFFIGPLMIRDTIDREVEAVDSEFQLASPSDSSRKELLFGSLARPGHPMGKFFWGNSQTLKLMPKESNIDTYARLKEFCKRHYSAHYMTLAVQSKETLDTLEAWVKEIFSQVPNNGLPKPDFSEFRDPFETSAFNKLYRVVPVKKVHSLNITWALPPQKQYYRIKPLHYISWLIGHEGTGSILSLLRTRCLALALFGGNGETGFEQNSTYSVFNISITLTDDGYQQFYEVAHIVFQYMKMLQKLGPQERIYCEIQKIEENEFHYQEQTDPIDFVENVCENMQLFRKEDFLTGDQLMFEYNPEVIAAACSLLTPQRANLILLSPNHKEKCTLKERWFGTLYDVEDIDKYWADLWAGDFPLNSALHLPRENKYIATDFALKKSDRTDTLYPVKILDNKNGRLWYKKDTKFQIPKGYIRFHLISPHIHKSPENLVLFDLFVNIVAHNLAEPAYEADVAQLEYKLVAEEHGLIIKVKGFNHKLGLLFQLIIDHLAEFTTTPDVFGMIGEQLKKCYFNVLIKPEKLGKDVRLSILEHGRWSLIQKHQTLMKGGITIEALMSFVKNFKSHLFVEGLVQGNFTSKESIEFLNYIVQKLQCKPLVKSVPVQFKVVELPNKAHVCKVSSLNKHDANSEVTVYYQSGPRKVKDYALMELLIMHMEEPCFDFLRTKETLGYHVYPSCRNTSGILGFSVTVETQASKFNTELVDNKIEEFLQSFSAKLATMSQESFSSQVTALIKLKLCEDTHLGEEVDRNWDEVFTQQYLFDRLVHEIRALQSFTKEDLVNWFRTHKEHKSKKLSIHVTGHGQHEPDLTNVASCESKFIHGEACQLIYLPVSPQMEYATTINDITAFNSKLKLYPLHKILK